MNQYSSKNAFSLISGVILITTFSLSAAASDVWCWRASVYDTDGDGYAVAGASKAARQLVKNVPYADRMTCPVGWVMLAGDCDDNNANVRPRQPEVYGNNMDDNCNGLMDEPEFQYDQTGWWNNRNSLFLVVTINEPMAYRAWKEGQLRYRLEYQEVTDTGTSMFTDTKPVDWIYPANDPDGNPIKITSMKLDGLEEGTVYRTRIQFFWEFLNAGKVYYYPVDDPSDWYYSATEASDATDQARMSSVLFALSEYYQSQYRGTRGYRGTDKPDGTEYGAVMGEYWCSEFYSHVTDPFLNAMGHREGFDLLIDYFRGYRRYFNSKIALRLPRAPAGSFLACSGHLDGNINHSAMLLGYNKDTGCIFTVEGNAGNQVKLVEHCESGFVLGIGWINDEMVTVP